MGVPLLRWLHGPEKELPKWVWVVWFVLSAVFGLIALASWSDGQSWWVVQAGLAWVYLTVLALPQHRTWQLQQRDRATRTAA